ncbi:hypothetical protein ACMHYO_21830, partial [Allopusillimonas ginsengisoli]|uniref:hypothetical protein n=1 Tax=Allopusillimonas ginsengisoli TaxID=453575 RepID=UPI0039C2B823
CIKKGCTLFHKGCTLFGRGHSSGLIRLQRDIECLIASAFSPNRAQSGRPTDFDNSLHRVN